MYFLNRSKCAINGWYYCHLHVQQYLQFFGKFKIYIRSIHLLSTFCRLPEQRNLLYLYSLYYILYLRSNISSYKFSYNQGSVSDIGYFSLQQIDVHYCHLFSWQVHFGLPLPHLYNGPFSLDWKRREKYGKKMYIR